MLSTVPRALHCGGVGLKLLSSLSTNETLLRKYGCSCAVALLLEAGVGLQHSAWDSFPEGDLTLHGAFWDTWSEQLPSLGFPTVEHHPPGDGVLGRAEPELCQHREPGGTLNSRKTFSG